MNFECFRMTKSRQKWIFGVSAALILCAIIIVVIVCCRGQSDNQADTKQKETQKPDQAKHWIVNNELYHGIGSSQSQYSIGSPSSCAINALEGVLQMQLGSPLNGELIDGILGLGAMYRSDKHCIVEEVYMAVSRFNNHLQITGGGPAAPLQFETRDWTPVLNRITRNEGTSAVLTKTPETVVLHFDRHRRFIIFDSHPRPPELKGAHFLVFNTRQRVEEYLKVLFPFVADFPIIYNVCEVIMFKMKHNVNPANVMDYDKQQTRFELEAIA